nr:uncharacterized protein LOC110377492 [Helicoverpa armigera]
MFREFAILLCAGIFLCGSASDSKDQNAATHYPDADAYAAPGDHLALPSDASYQQVASPTSAYLPTQRQNYAYDVKPAVVQAYRIPIQNQQAASSLAPVASQSSSQQYKNTYIPAAQPVNQYYTVSVPAKTVSIGPSGTYNAQGSNIYASQGQNVNPAVYTNNVAAPRPFTPAPIVASKTVVESNRAVNVQPSSGYVNQNAVPAYSINSAPEQQYYLVPLSANTAPVQPQGVQAQSPAVASYQVNHIQAVNQAPQQNIPVPKFTYNYANPLVKSIPVPSVPVASKSVAVESYNSVTAHPPTAPRYESGPLIRYAPVQVPVTKPIPVPVIYPSVETHHASVQQIPVPTATTHSQQQVNSDPGQVTSSGAGVKYHSVAVVPNVAQPKGYAKSVVFSPASEVSRVTFNGLGVTYGW